MSKNKMEMSQTKERFQFWYSGIKNELATWKSAEKNLPWRGADAPIDKTQGRVSLARSQP